MGCLSVTAPEYTHSYSMEIDIFFYFLLIFLILAGDEESYKIKDEFELRADQTTTAELATL